MFTYTHTYRTEEHRVEQNRNGQKRTAQNSTEQDRKVQNRTEKYRTEQNSTEQNRKYCIEQNRTGQSRNYSAVQYRIVQNSTVHSQGSPCESLGVTWFFPQSRVRVARPDCGRWWGGKEDVADPDWMGTDVWIDRYHFTIVETRETRTTQQTCVLQNRR